MLTGGGCLAGGIFGRAQQRHQERHCTCLSNVHLHQAVGQMVVVVVMCAVCV